MKKEDIKMIISDIDGTLINDQDELPTNFKEMISELDKRGIIFVAASGRSASSIKNKLQHDADNIYLISDNGAIIMHKGEIINASTFSKEEFDELCGHMVTYKGNTVGVVTLDAGYVQLAHEDVDQGFLDEFFYGNVEVDDVTKVTGNVVGISIHNTHNTVENLNGEAMAPFREKYELVQAGAEWIDAIPKNTNKGSSVEKLLEILGLTTDNAIAFGDYNNDLEMIQTVKMGFAMEDATDELKAVADEVIGSNNDNGIIKKIYELLEI